MDQERDPQIWKQKLTATTARRWKERPAELRGVLEFAAELRRLSSRYPRFRRPVNKLIHAAESQLQSTQTKERAIIRALTRWRILDFNELMSESVFDEITVGQTVSGLIEKRVIEKCARDGGPIGGKGSGKAWRTRTYFRLAREAKREDREDIAA